MPNTIKGISGQTLEAGSYTPTLANVANTSARTAEACYYTRVGNLVTVSGSCQVDPIAGATLTRITITLPIASNLSSYLQLKGVAFGDTAQGGTLYGDSTSDVAELAFVSVGTANLGINFIFTYEII